MITALPLIPLLTVTILSHLGQSFMPGRFFYSLLQILAQALTRPTHHLTSGFTCSFPGLSTFFLLQSSQQQLKGHISDRHDSSSSCCSGMMTVSVSSAGGLTASILGSLPCSLTGPIQSSQLHPQFIRNILVPSSQTTLPPFPHVLCSHTGSSVTLHHTKGQQHPPP